MIAVAAIAALAAPVAASEKTYTRSSGVDRYATAVQVSRDFAFDAYSSVVVASGEDYPDAVSGSALAAVLHVPLLLVRHDQVPTVTADRLAELRPGVVILVGGTSAASDGVAAELATYTRDGRVWRYAGSDRYATSLEAARAVGGGSKEAWVASGASFADALVAAALAGASGRPLVLLPPGRIPAPLLEGIHELAPNVVSIVGGVNAVSDEAEQQLDDVTALVNRTSGPDRYATAAEVAARSNSVSHVVVASGSGFADALAAAPAAVVLGRFPLLLVPGTCVPDAVRAQLDRDGVAFVHIIGGVAAVNGVEEERPC